MSQPAKILDEKGRCCGRKPIAYKRPTSLYCDRCDALYDKQGKQIQNWAFSYLGDGHFLDMHDTRAVVGTAHE